MSIKHPIRAERVYLAYTGVGAAPFASLPPEEKASWDRVVVYLDSFVTKEEAMVALEKSPDTWVEKA